MNINREAIVFNGSDEKYRVADVPFGLQLIVQRLNGSWHWEMNNHYYMMKKGKCNSREKAEKKVIDMYIAYVEKNLQMLLT